MSELDLVVNALVELDPNLNSKLVRLIGEVEGVEKLKEALKSLKFIEAMRIK